MDVRLCEKFWMRIWVGKFEEAVTVGLFALILTVVCYLLILLVWRSNGFEFELFRVFLPDDKVQ